MNKLSYMKSSTQAFREFLRPSRYLYQPKYEDKFLETGPKFKHTWAQMAHMHDLRLWTIAYAPGKKNNIQRLQEIHGLNQEMWYQVYRSLWTRILWGVPLFLFVTRVAKDRFMKKYNRDSHDPSFRDVTAHM
jgi:hypothetical protein